MIKISILLLIAFNFSDSNAAVTSTQQWMLAEAKIMEQFEHLRNDFREEKIVETCKGVSESTLECFKVQSEHVFGDPRDSARILIAFQYLALFNKAKDRFKKGELSKIAMVTEISAFSRHQMEMLKLFVERPKHYFVQVLNLGDEVPSIETEKKFETFKKVHPTWFGANDLFSGVEKQLVAHLDLEIANKLRTKVGSYIPGLLQMLQKKCLEYSETKEAIKNCKSADESARAQLKLYEDRLKLYEDRLKQIYKEGPLGVVSSL